VISYRCLRLDHSKREPANIDALHTLPLKLIEQRCVNSMDVGHKDPLPMHIQNLIVPVLFHVGYRSQVAHRRSRQVLRDEHLSRDLSVTEEALFCD
jgi:hypothetical protein